VDSHLGVSFIVSSAKDRKIVRRSLTSLFERTHSTSATWASTYSSSISGLAASPAVASVWSLSFRQTHWSWQVESRPSYLGLICSFRLRARRSFLWRCRQWPLPEGLRLSRRALAQRRTSPGAGSCGGSSGSASRSRGVAGGVRDDSD